MVIDIGRYYIVLRNRNYDVLRGSEIQSLTKAGEELTVSSFLYTSTERARSNLDELLPYHEKRDVLLRSLNTPTKFVDTIKMMGKMKENFIIKRSLFYVIRWYHDEKKETEYGVASGEDVINSVYNKELDIFKRNGFVQYIMTRSFEEKEKAEEFIHFPANLKKESFAKLNDVLYETLPYEDRMKKAGYGSYVSPNPLDRQEAGDHYVGLAIQPAVYCQRNRLGYIESSVVKYVTRHKKKNGAEDIKKAIHFLQLLLKIDYQEGTENDKANSLRDDLVRSGIFDPVNLRNHTSEPNPDSDSDAS